MTSRRSLLTAAAATLAAPFASASSRRELAVLKAPTEHWVPGGMGGIQRGQFGFTATSNSGGYGTIKIPQPDLVYMVPLTVGIFDESGGARYQLQGDGLVTVMTTGLYELTANLDWPAQPRDSGQDGYDTNMRKVMIRRVPVGVAPPVYRPGEVTQIPGNSKLYDGLASHDTPGSSSPNAVRTSVPWSPGTIAVGGMAYLDVTLPVGSFTPTVGDFVRASHSSLTDAALGAVNAGLLVSARIVAPLLARVMIENRYNASPVTVPSGTMNLLAESAVSSTGNNEDAWTFVNSGAVMLLANEKLMIAVRSKSPGDYLQIDNVSFLRIANIVP